MTKNKAYVIFPFLDIDGKFIIDNYSAGNYKKTDDKGNLYVCYADLSMDPSIVEGYKHVYFIIPDSELKYEMVGRLICSGDSVSARCLILEGDFSFENFIERMNRLLNDVLHNSKSQVHQITIRNNYSLKEFFKTENKG